jgi:hypothetical protein
MVTSMWTRYNVPYSNTGTHLILPPSSHLPRASSAGQLGISSLSPPENTTLILHGRITYHRERQPYARDTAWPKSVGRSTRDSFPRSKSETGCAYKTRQGTFHLLCMLVTVGYCLHMVIWYFCVNFFFSFPNRVVLPLQIRRLRIKHHWILS